MDPPQPDKVDPIIFLCAESIRICGILLQPYMPSKMKILLDMLGVKNDARGFIDTKFGADGLYGKSFIDVGRGQQGVLFPPLRSHF